MNMFRAKKYQQPSRMWVHLLEHNHPQKRVVKKGGITEQYNRKKLALSVHKACMDASGYIGEAEMTALQVCKEVEGWLEDRFEVTSNDIKRKASAALQKFHPTAAYEYSPSKELRLNRDEYGLVRL